MKNVNMQTNLRSKLMILAFIGLVGCSKDKNNEPKPSSEITAAIGTFKGKLRVSERDYFNAIIIVSKESTDIVKLSAKTGEPYSTVTTKSFKVQNVSNIHISSTNSPSGSFTYIMASKSVQISTEKEGANEIPFYFEGVKQ